jgi:hypothetical protein
LDKVGGAEESPFKAFSDLVVADADPLVEDEDPEISLDLVFFPAPQQHEVVLDEGDLHLLSEGPEGKGRIGELGQVLDHVGSFGVAVDVADTGHVVLVGVDDARGVAVAPEVSGSPDRFVVADGDSGVEVLHGSMEVFLSGGGDDMVMVGHEDEVVDGKAIFFHGFLQGLEDDPDGLSLVEPEGPVVGPADQVVGQLGLDDAKRTSHAFVLARSLPTLTALTISCFDTEKHREKRYFR